MKIEQAHCSHCRYIFHSIRGFNSIRCPSILRISIRYSNNTDTRSNQYLNGANVQYHGFNLAKYIFTRLFPIVCNYLKNHFSRFCDDTWRDDITLINGFSGESLNWNWKKQKIETLGGRISFDGKKKREKFDRDKTQEVLSDFLIRVTWGSSRVRGQAGVSDTVVVLPTSPVETCKYSPVSFPDFETPRTRDFIT